MIPRTWRASRQNSGFEVLTTTPKAAAMSRWVWISSATRNLRLTKRSRLDGPPETRPRRRPRSKQGTRLLAMLLQRCDLLLNRLLDNNLCDIGSNSFPQFDKNKSFWCKLNLLTQKPFSIWTFTRTGETKWKLNPNDNKILNCRNYNPECSDCN